METGEGKIFYLDGDEPFFSFRRTIFIIELRIKSNQTHSIVEFLNNFEG